MTSRSSLLVIGAGGFVGAACTRHLLALGHRVFALDSGRHGAIPAGATGLVGDIEDLDSLRAAMATAQPAAVLNFAAFSAGPIGLARSGEAAPERALAVNLLGMHRLMQAVLEAGVPRLLWSSSTVVLGAADGLERVTETAPCNPITSYGLSKHLAEQAALFMRRTRGLAVTGVRLPLVVGPGLWYSGAAAALKQLVAGEAAAVSNPDTPFDAAHVQDVARLFAHLLEQPRLAPLYHLAGFTTCWREVAATLGGELLPAPPGIIWPLVSQALLEQDTGFACTHDLRATLRDMLEHRA